MSSPRQPDAAAILRSLYAVERERGRRAAEPGLGKRVLALKAYQQARFRDGYADLLASPRHAPAARFFIDELYGPRDFSQRDEQFVRIVPAVGRLFPAEVAGTVAALAELHALSESLDSTMGEALASPSIDAAAYVQAWQATGREADRERQIELVLHIGASLDRYTRMPVLAMSLRMMRAPARAAGLTDLQRFLETGFATFKAMGGADDFLQTIAKRERAFAARLFGMDPASVRALSGPFP